MMRHRASAWVCTLAWTVLWMAGAARAQQPAARNSPLVAGDVADVHKRPRTVAVLPVKNYLVRPADLFAPEALPASDPGALAVQVAVLAALHAATYVDVVAPDGTRHALLGAPDAAGRVQAAQAAYRMGLELYLGLSSARAIDKLRTAGREFAEAFTDVFDAKASADAQFMLGVALVDSGRSAEGHVALKAGFSQQPDRRFRRDFFPPAAANALQTALTDLLSTVDPLRPYGDNQRMAALARKLGVGWLVLTSLRKGERGPIASIAVFSAHKRLVEAEAHLPIEQIGARLEPFLSRWLACVPIDTTAVAPASPLRVWTDMAVSWAPFLQQPTRRDFQSLGFAGGADVVLRQNLHWFGRLGLYTSVPDAYRDLLRSFNSARVVTGLGAAGRTGPLRYFVNLGVDAHLLGSFVTSVDPDCKLFGTEHRLCDRGSLLNLESQVLFGAHAAVGGQLHLGRDFLLALRLSVSNYFLPLDGTDRLNRPLGVELGFGYRI
ncbi:MAG: hypothetical protein FJ100_12830 [Deltaproteobacteria bacterium]|nr:hypothetical protein [Deltaproteobacteria bacterium]